MQSNPSIEKSNPAHPNRERFFDAFAALGNDGKGCAALIRRNTQKSVAELVAGFVKRKIKLFGTR